MKSLIIVESPAKIKTLSRFLGDSFEFASSVGHVRDLPEKSFGIDVDNDFEPQYVLLEKKKKIIEELRRSSKKADIIYLAMDPDREGESIAWHISKVLPDGLNIKRISFNAITEKAVRDALSAPREIDIHLVDAQQARRLLDRMVGYKISPILNRKISYQGKLSAGRVQSVALKMVVKREKAIRDFIPKEYWDISGQFKKERLFEGYLYKISGKRVVKEASKNQVTISNEEEALNIKKIAEHSTFKVSYIDSTIKSRHPVAPFITSSLQQEASRHFGFSPNRTMTAAQNLYMGIDGIGLITYLRTDSTRVAPEAMTSAERFIKESFGSSFLPKKRPFYQKTGAQDAHESIRPTDITKRPEELSKDLPPDEGKIYSLIWKRFLASQMREATYDSMVLELSSESLTFRSVGSKIREKGFLIVYEEKKDEESDGKNTLLPHLAIGEEVYLSKVIIKQSFTKPLPRFTEASLIKELEKCGVGRPSTYATILQKIAGRQYTKREGKRLHPTELGFVVSSLLDIGFPKIVDVKFTATMESNLDKIGSLDVNWRTFLKEFWEEFSPTLDAAKEITLPKEESSKRCPECGSLLLKIWGKGHFFLGCSNYPECDHKEPLEVLVIDKSQFQEDFNWGQPCPICAGPMKPRQGRYGVFLGCSSYPQCKGIVSIPKKGAEPLPPCPLQGCNGQVVKREGAKRSFYSCSRYPQCNLFMRSLDDIEDMRGRPSKPYEKKKFKKPSEALAKIIGNDETNFTKATKKFWEYVKKHDLQNPENKKQILPKEDLEELFEGKVIDIFQVSKIISRNLI